MRWGWGRGFENENGEGGLWEWREALWGLCLGMLWVLLRLQIDTCYCISLDCAPCLGIKVVRIKYVRFVQPLIHQYDFHKRHISTESMHVIQSHTINAASTINCAAPVLNVNIPFLKLLLMYHVHRVVASYAFVKAYVLHL
jgi:hypothetical protein